MLTNQVNIREITYDPADMRKYESGALIQDAFPYLSPDDREFLKSGITPEEWDYFLSEDQE